MARTGSFSRSNKQVVLRTPMLPYKRGATAPAAAAPVTVKGLTDIPGIRVGHVSDYEALTGCTAILCEQGAVGGVDIRGSASGTEETPTLDPGHLDDSVHAILLAGG